MQVFKVVLKIIRRNLHVLSIYVFVFVFLNGALSMMSTSNGSAEYHSVKSRVMVINKDAGQGVADGLEEYMGQVGIPIAPAESDEEILDAMFYADAEYILTIPEGFSEDFLSGRHEMTIGKQTVASSTSAVWTDMMVEKYLELFRVQAELSEVDTEDTTAVYGISQNVMEQLENETKVVHVSGEPQDNDSVITFSFKFMAYSLMAVIILGVASILKVFNDRDFRNRLRSSPENSSGVGLQMMLGNFCFVVVVWALLVLVCMFLFGFDASKPWSWILVLNTFVFSVCILSLSMLIGHLVKTDNARSAVANVVALGSCFLGGVFVPQEFLSDTVKTIASFMPAFWYVKVIEEAKNLTSYAWSDVDSIFGYMAIQLGFGIAFTLITMIVSRERSRKTV
ncbi:MAG: ABC transporter permease [Clostridiales bacterium]|nr:ABC transporter permease [Clostridiales bacterium]